MCFFFLFFDGGSFSFPLFSLFSFGNGSEFFFLATVNDLRPVFLLFARDGQAIFFPLFFFWKRGGIGAFFFPR